MTPHRLGLPRVREERARGDGSVVMLRTKLSAKSAAAEKGGAYGDERGPRDVMW